MPVKIDEVQEFIPCFCLCCCASGPLRVDAYTPVRGYAPGQTINLKIDVTNDSSYSLYKMQVQLIKVRNHQYFCHNSLIINESERISQLLAMGMDVDMAKVADL